MPSAAALRSEHWINGSSTARTSTRTAPIWNPATGEQTRQVVLGSTQDVTDAVRSGLEIGTLDQWQLHRRNVYPHRTDLEPGHRRTDQTGGAWQYPGCDGCRPQRP